MRKIVLIIGIIVGLLLIGIASASDFGPWTTETVDQTKNVGEYTSLALNSLDYPRISYLDKTHGDLKYAAWDGTSWKIETVDGTTKNLNDPSQKGREYNRAEVGEYSSLALDAAGNPRISYFDKTHGDLKYAAWDGTSWKIETVDGATKKVNDHSQKGREYNYGEVGEYSSLALDAAGNPRISYFDKTHGDLKYAVWDGTSWKIETVDSSGKVGEFTSIKLDINKDPRISYYDRTNGDLKFAAWNGAIWQIETVDSTKKVGIYTSLSLDSVGDARISYYDEKNHDLKFAKGTGHQQRNQIAGDLYGKPISAGEFLEKVFPGFFDNMSPESKQKYYDKMIDWNQPENAEEKLSGYLPATFLSKSSLGTDGQIAAASGTGTAVLGWGDSDINTNLPNVIHSARTYTLFPYPTYPVPAIAVASYLQRWNPQGDWDQNPWDQKDDSTNILYNKGYVATEKAKIVSECGYYRTFGVHALWLESPQIPCPLGCELNPYKSSISRTIWVNSGSTQYTINAFSGLGGSINPPGVSTVNCGDTPTFTIKPGSGYVVDQILVDNSPVTENPYTFPPVVADHTISATFIPASVSGPDWIWSRDGWGDWEHIATWSGNIVGPCSEYGPVMVNGHGEHGANVNLNSGSGSSSVWRTFTDPSGSGWNTIIFEGLMSGSDRPGGRWMTIDVNGQQVFGGTAGQTPPGNNQMFEITGSFPQSSTVTVKISNGQNPLWGPWFYMEFHSLKLTQGTALRMTDNEAPFVIPDGSGLVTNGTASQ